MGKIITKAMESRGRKKIAKLLSLMGFHDDDPASTAQIMRERLRKIEERTKAATAQTNFLCSMNIRKITFKFGGKKVDPTKVPLQTPISEIIRGQDADDMEIDSSNISYDHIDDHDQVDQSFEETRLMMMVQTTDGNDDNMEINPNLPVEDPNSNMINDNGDENDNENNDGEMDIREFIRSIGGSEAELVIEKTLTKSDCSENLGRLLIPGLQVTNPDFLAVNEKKKLRMRESISVEVYDPERRKLTLNLAQWKMKHENYVLTTNWKNLVFTNGLKENMVIQVLSFRVDQKLCFAVVRV